jgi:hypothetical protein
LAASSFAGAGSRRFRSRSFMNSSYFAVPGRGGASAGKPPAHWGIISPNPAASFSLMAPHALRPHARGATASRMARWRVLIGICEASVTPYVVDLHTGCAGHFAGRTVWPDWGPEPTQQIGKIGLLTFLGIRILVNYLEKLGRAGRNDDESATRPVAPIVEIDIAARIRRHAAPARG